VAGGEVRKSEEGVGGAGGEFALIDDGSLQDGFMVLYCDDVEGGGEGLLRVVKLQNFSIVDEYDCDVVVTCMRVIEQHMWCGGADGEIYVLQIVPPLQQQLSHPQLLPPVILSHHSYLIR
jgi:hypothetical protein